MIKKIVFFLLAALLAVILLANQPASVRAQEETPTETPTITPTETPVPTATALYIYDRTITAGDTFVINAQVIDGAIQDALLLTIIFLIVFRRVK